MDGGMGEVGGGKEARRSSCARRAGVILVVVENHHKKSFSFPCRTRPMMTGTLGEDSDLASDFAGGCVVS